MQLTRTFGAKWRANPTVMAFTPAFAAAIARWYTGSVAGSTFATATGAASAAANAHTSRRSAAVRPGSAQGRSVSLIYANDCPHCMALLRKLPEFAAGVVSDNDRLLVWLLRQAVILCRSRAEPRLPDVKVEASSKRFRLTLPEGWLERRPLTQRALEEEAVYWNAVGIKYPFA